MSGIVEEAERMRELGISIDKETSFCTNHFNNKYIQKYIRANTYDGYCHYCNKNKKVIDLKDFMVYYMEIVTQFYSDASNFMGYDGREGGYLGQTLEPYELYDEFNPKANNCELEQAIINSIEDKAWACEEEHYGTSDKDILNFSWNFFKNIVKHKARYLFYNTSIFQDDFYKIKAYSILEEVSKGIKKLKLFTVLPSETALYRCRQHNRKIVIRDAKEITAPPTVNAIYPNRMSPAGISMFYGAMKKNTALIEVVDTEDKKRKYVTSAIFRNKEKLNLIDFTKLPQLNPFNPKQLKDYYLLSFLNEFVEDLSKPIQHDNKIHIEYVPTQILTEFFRYIHPNHKIRVDGIIYPSSKDWNAKAVVLFMDHKESLEKLTFDKSSLNREKIEPSDYKLV